MAAFQRIARFEDSQGQIQYGELSHDTAWDASLVDLEVMTYPVDIVPWSKDFVLTEVKSRIKRVGLDESEVELTFIDKTS